MTRVAGAVIVSALAFFIYRATLLPGFDFGDTPSFQVMAGKPNITPRDGYPLYFAIGGLFVKGMGGDRAHALNTASAVEAAAACGIVVLLASEIAGSLAVGLAVAWLFAGSYTFWSQAIIAEVYALHIAFVAATLLLLFAWDARPSDRRLFAFLAVYALGFNNHLTMILLLPAYAGLIVMRLGWRASLSLRVLTTAMICAVAGSLPYLWNLRALWLAPLPPHDLLEGLRAFWFDVTKADWRQTMMLGVPGDMAGERVRMYAFDVRQQFGVAALVLAAIGAWHLLRSAPRRAFVLAGVYLVTVAFALSYNVGDTHVFLLPSHLVIALFAASGAAGLAALVPSLGFAPTIPTTVMATAVGLLATARMYTDFPALDRSADTRATQLLESMTAGIDDRHAVLLTDLNWQIDNGMNYFARNVRTDVAAARLSDVIRYAPQFVFDNESIGRQVVATRRAASTLTQTYGPLLALTPAVPAQSITYMTLQEAVRDVPTGTRYVLCILRPTRDMMLDTSTVADAFEQLTTGDTLRADTTLERAMTLDYTAVIGVTGRSPVLISSSARPSSLDVDLAGVSVRIRMDSWLAFDTIRRMGFGHVIANRQHTLIIERGVSFVAFDAQGRPIRTAYMANIFEPQPRFRVALTSTR